MHAYAFSSEQNNIDIFNEKIFFTSIDKETGIITGYQLD